MTDRDMLQKRACGENSGVILKAAGTQEVRHKDRLTPAARGEDTNKGKNSSSDEIQASRGLDSNASSAAT